MEKHFINHMIDSRSHVKVIISNGFQLRGCITGQDDTAILFMGGGDKVGRLIYKHAISTIEPIAE